MITLNTENKICLSFGGNTYCFDDEDEYRMLVLAITDPSAAIPLVENDLEIDSEVNNDYLPICERYKSTLKAYLVKRDEILAPSSTDEKLDAEQPE